MARRTKLFGKCKKYEVRVVTRGGVLATTPVKTIKEGRKYIRDYKEASKSLNINLRDRKFSIARNKECK